MPHFYPIRINSGRSLAGDSLGFHAYSLRIDNLTNQWLLEETSMAWIPPYSLGTCLRLYGTGVAIILNQAPIGQPQLAPVVGEQTVGVYSDQLRTEVGGQPVRQFTAVLTVSDLTWSAQPALPPPGVSRLYADSVGTLHYLLPSGADRTLIDTNNLAANVATQPLGGDTTGPINNNTNVKASGDFIAAGRLAAGAVVSAAQPGDLVAVRTATPTIGALYLSNDATRFLSYNGSTYNLGGAGVFLNGISGTNLIRERTYGYGAGTYFTAQVGGNRSISLGVDVSAIAGGNFAAGPGEVVIPNTFYFTQVNSTGTDFLNAVIKFTAATITTPHLTGPNDNAGAQQAWILGTNSPGNGNVYCPVGTITSLRSGKKALQITADSECLAKVTTKAVQSWSYAADPSDPSENPDVKAPILHTHNGRSIGFMVDEMIDVVPEVIGTIDGEPFGINYQLLTSVLWGAVRALNERMDRAGLAA